MTCEVATPLLRFSMADVEWANATWGCNCGPAALGACLGWTLDEVRPHLGAFELRGYLSPSMMLAAIRSAGFTQASAAGLHLPRHGLARVQFGGPWLNPGVPAKAAYAYTHWIAVKQAGEACWVYDVNAGWERRFRWEGGTALRIMDSIKRCDGRYTFTHLWEVRKS